VSLPSSVMGPARYIFFQKKGQNDFFNVEISQNRKIFPKRGIFQGGKFNGLACNRCPGPPPATPTTNAPKLMLLSMTIKSPLVESPPPNLAQKFSAQLLPLFLPCLCPLPFPFHGKRKVSCFNLIGILAKTHKSNDPESNIFGTPLGKHGNSVFFLWESMGLFLTEIALPRESNLVRILMKLLSPEENNVNSASETTERLRVQARNILQCLIVPIPYLKTCLRKCTPSSLWTPHKSILVRILMKLLSPGRAISLRSCRKCSLRRTS
jgi:hypothetical protein